MDTVGKQVLEELRKKVACSAMELGAEIQGVMIGEESFSDFSKYITELKDLLLALHEKRIEYSTGSGRTKAGLETLDTQLKNACKAIKKLKAGSRLRLLVNCNSVLTQIRQLAREIAETVSLLGLANVETTLNVKSTTDKIANDLKSMEFRSAATTEAISIEIGRLVTQNIRNRDRTVELLHKVAEAVGASPNASLVRNELELLKREKEEMEAQKKQAEALQLSQLIQFLYSSEMVANPQEERIGSPISSFTCTLCNELMEYPVAIVCGHSFEKKAILEWFGRGETTCPTCKQELPSLDLTPNNTLRSSIEEWKQRNMDSQLQRAVSGLASDDSDMINQALEDLQLLMEAPRYRAEVSKKGLIPTIVKSLKASNVNAKVALKCLRYLANYCEDNKEAIVEAGAIRCIVSIVKQFYRRETETDDALAVLVELSEKETLAEKIGDAKDSIPSLVSLLQNHNTDISEKAQKVLLKLSSNTHFIIKMAEAQHFQPFLAHFRQEPMETKTLMTKALLNMQLDNNSVTELEHKKFVKPLVQMLQSSSLPCKSACLQCIKKLSAYPKMAKRFLAESSLISDLVGLISFVGSESHWKQDSIEILISLVRASQLSDLQSNPRLQELQSQHHVHLFLHLADTSPVPQIKAQFLSLLLMIGNKSEMVRNLVRSDNNAMAHLFSSLESDQHNEVRQNSLKLIYSIAEDHPSGVPLPPSPTAKESAINAIVNILTKSRETEERSTAAGIISKLPSNDPVVDDILRKSEALKAIREVICCNTDDDERMGIKIVTPPANLARSSSLLENALAVLLRYTEPTKPELQRQLGEIEIYPSLVRVLSIGTSLAKQRTAVALAHLSKSTNQSFNEEAIAVGQAKSLVQFLSLTTFCPNLSWCCSPTSARHHNLCSIHGSACSSKHTFCLIKADAVRPLVQTLSETRSGAAEAALEALDTLLKDDGTISHAAATIAKSQGITAIHEVLEKGSISAKDKALDIFQKIFEHSQMTKPQAQRSERILIHLLQDDTLKKKAALVLSLMGVLPQQSSYF